MTDDLKDIAADLLKEVAPRLMRQIHEGRWLSTYNAALQRNANFSHSKDADPKDVQSAHEYVHLQCARYADYAHGPRPGPSREELLSRVLGVKEFYERADALVLEWLAPTGSGITQPTRAACADQLRALLKGVR